MIYESENLEKHKHFFFGSAEGVSKGVYSSLNTNNLSLDAPENVRKNLEIIAAKSKLEPKNLMLLEQGFSNTAHYVETPSFRKIAGDGIVTDKPGIILCVRTADCAPVLFADYENGIIGCSHAGWRSALKGIMENTLNLMIKKGAKLKNIRAAIGPCLQKHSFDAGDDMLEQFASVNENFAEYFHPNNEKYLFDFEKFVSDKLANYGLDNISKSGIDTYADKNFFSFRRSGHLKQIKQAGDFPTQLSTIVL
ncbi:MAG: peptidoglycan editing factor PgeF [Lactobacillaceae bacterium]|jgi:YfiH family protein|nr:peptidoglycan editing factor PgeF [Lactobacillaceae bacterium]